MLSKASVKDIQSLQHKKYRDELGRFVAEGPKVVGELLASDVFPCIALYATEDWFSSCPSLLRSRLPDTAQPVTATDLQRISQLSTPNQVLAVFGQRESGPPPEATRGGVTLVLDGIQDPGNLGTIIRSADWFGAGPIICSPDTVDCYNPKVVQSTMASLARVRVHYTHLADWLGLQTGLPVLAATREGTPLSSFSLDAGVILVIGNESKGVSAPLLSRADHRVCITGKGEAESLNAAVACSILLYHFSA